MAADPTSFTYGVRRLNKQAMRQRGWNAPQALTNRPNRSPVSEERQAALRDLASRNTNAAISSLGQTNMVAGGTNLAQLVANLPAPQAGKARGRVKYGQGAVGQLAQRLSGASGIKGLTRRINNAFSGFDSPQSHQDESAYERDITLRPGASGQESSELRLLAKALYRAYGPKGANVLTELIFDPWGSYFGAGRNKQPYGGHMDHLHFSTGGRTKW